MKLRLRSIQSKETLKIEVPNSCTLPQLKQILSQLLPNSPHLASIRLSLNRKDDLHSDGEGFLSSLGIASGDLIFFSIEHPSTGTSLNSPNSQNLLPPRSDSSPNLEANITEGSNSSVSLDSREGETLGNDKSVEGNEQDYMEIDGEGNEIRVNSEGILSENSFSIPGFLRKVFSEELDNNCGRDHKLIVIAIHAVMLESGFVALDNNTNEAISGFQFRHYWSPNLLGMTLHYTLPEILNQDIKFVILKFQSLRNFITVYATLGSNESGKGGTYRVHLNEDQLTPFLNVVWANCGESEVIESLTSPEKEVFKFWRIVKDNLALPLLIDLCEEAGLDLPPCFTRLPTDLKLKILESLGGVDLARVTCVSSELQYLGSNDELWKLKYLEEFGNGSMVAYGSWKRAFAMSWVLRKSRSAVECRVRPSPFWPAPYVVHPRRRYPNPFMVPRVPRIIGGDYDVFPDHRGDDVHGRRASRDYRRMDFSTRCNLGCRGGRFV